MIIPLYGIAFIMSVIFFMLSAVKICPQADLKSVIDDNGGEQDEEEQQYMVYLPAAQICNTYEKQNGNEHAAQIDQIIAPDGALGMWILAASFSQRKKISYKVVLSLFLAQIVSVGVYAGERMLHSRVEWMTFVYLLDEILILSLIRRIGMYEVSDNIANALEEHSTYFSASRPATPP